MGRFRRWRSSLLAVPYAVAVGVSALYALALAGSAAAAAPCGTGGVFSQSGSRVTCTYGGDGSAFTDTFTVPSGVSSLDVIAVGAEGGGAGTPLGTGGAGASVEDASVPVSGGQVLPVVVGGVGSLGGFGAASAAGGTPGGGGAGGGGPSYVRGGGGGGGYSGLFDPSNTPLVIAAGGGGGGGASKNAGGAGDTGNGGGSGVNGFCVEDEGGPGGGALGGVGGSAGAGGGGAGNGGPGMSLAGGPGGASTQSVPALASGGGGGGGYAGGGGAGGGGCGGGGGGGSSFGISGLTNEMTATGDASVAISYTVPASELAAILVSDSTGKGPGKALADKAAAIQNAVNAQPSQTATACADITDYLGLVKAQTNKKLSQSEATTLTNDATALAGALGCT